MKTFDRKQINLLFRGWLLKKSHFQNANLVARLLVTLNVGFPSTSVLSYM